MNATPSHSTAMHFVRNAVVLAAFVITTIDFFRQFVLFSRSYDLMGQLMIFLVGVPVATIGGTLIAHLLLSLWNGTPFTANLIGYEPEPLLVE